MNKFEKEDDEHYKSDLAQLQEVTSNRITEAKKQAHEVSEAPKKSKEMEDARDRDDSDDIFPFEWAADNTTMAGEPTPGSKPESGTKEPTEEEDN